MPREAILLLSQSRNIVVADQRDDERETEERNLVDDALDAEPQGPSRSRRPAQIQQHRGIARDG